MSLYAQSFQFHMSALAYLHVYGLQGMLGTQVFCNISHDLPEIAAVRLYWAHRYAPTASGRTA